MVDLEKIKNDYPLVKKKNSDESLSESQPPLEKASFGSDSASSTEKDKKKTSVSCISFLLVAKTNQ